MNLETFLKIRTLSFLPTTCNRLNMPMKIKRKHMVGNPPKEQPIPLTFISTPTPWATFCPQDSSSSKKAYPFISSTFSNTLLRQQTSTNTRYQLLEGEEKLNVVLKHVSTFPHFYPSTSHFFHKHTIPENPILLSTVASYLLPEIFQCQTSSMSSLLLLIKPFFYTAKFKIPTYTSTFQP